MAKWQNEYLSSWYQQISWVVGISTAESFLKQVTPSWVWLPKTSTSDLSCDPLGGVHSFLHVNFDLCCVTHQTLMIEGVVFLVTNKDWQEWECLGVDDRWIHNLSVLLIHSSRWMMCVESGNGLSAFSPSGLVCIVLLRGVFPPQ